MKNLLYNFLRDPISNKSVIRIGGGAAKVE